MNFVLISPEIQAMYPGCGSQHSPALRENDRIYREMKNELIYSFGQNWGETNSHSVSVISLTVSLQCQNSWKVEEKKKARIYTNVASLSPRR
jgi:hypothetical protein